MDGFKNVSLNSKFCKFKMFYNILARVRSICLVNRVFKCKSESLSGCRNRLTRSNFWFCNSNDNFTKASWTVRSFYVEVVIG